MILPLEPSRFQGFLETREFSTSWRDTGPKGTGPYLRRQAIADGVHVVGGGPRIHEAVRVAGEAVPGAIGRAGVRSRGGRSQPTLMHGGRREGLGPVHSAASICGKTQRR